MFERLLGEQEVEGTPALMFIAGFLYSAVSVFFSIFIHPEASSAFIVGLTALAAMPLMVKVIEFETRALELFPGSVVQRERKIIVLYAWFFLGELLGFTCAFLALPPDAYALVTKYQEREMSVVLSTKEMLTGRFYHPEAFELIFWNNMRVFFMGVVLSFVYGTGGVFLITWNASLVSYLLATSIRETGSVLKGIELFLGILPHGVFEFCAYFVGGFLGGFISMLVIQEGVNRKLLKDTVLLLLSGVLLLLVGAWVESLAFAL